MHTVSAKTDDLLRARVPMRRCVGHAQAGGWVRGGCGGAGYGVWVVGYGGKGRGTGMGKGTVQASVGTGTGQSRYSQCSHSPVQPVQP